MILGLHHAHITIPKGSEDKGREFYCDLLGLSEIEKPESLKSRGGFWLKVGDREVHIGTEDVIDRTKSKAHLAYLADDITYWKDTLQQNGIDIIESIAIPGYRRFEFRDPFGNRVEMIQQENL